MLLDSSVFLFVLFRRPPLLDTKWKVTLASLALAILHKIPFEIFFLLFEREKN